jgi:hypothetical protein
MLRRGKDPMRRLTQLLQFAKVSIAEVRIQAVQQHARWQFYRRIAEVIGRLQEIAPLQVIR